MNTTYEIGHHTGHQVVVRINEFKGDLEDLMRTNGLYSTIALIEEYKTYSSPKSGWCYGEELNYTLARFSATQPDKDVFYFDSLSDKKKKFWFGTKSNGVWEVEGTEKISSVDLGAFIEGYTAADYINAEKTDLIDVNTEWTIAELIDCYDGSIPNICFERLGVKDGKD